MRSATKTCTCSDQRPHASDSCGRRLQRRACAGVTAIVSSDAVSWPSTNLRCPLKTLPFMSHFCYLSFAGIGMTIESEHVHIDLNTLLAQARSSCSPAWLTFVFLLTASTPRRRAGSTSPTSSPAYATGEPAADHPADAQHSPSLLRLHVTVLLLLSSVQETCNFDTMFAYLSEHHSFEPFPTSPQTDAPLTTRFSGGRLR